MSVAAAAAWIWLELVATAVPTSSSPRTANGTAGVSAGCALTRMGSADRSSASCLACHGTGRAAAGSGHPVGIDYGAAAAASQHEPVPLRPRDEAIRRGVFLPDGKVECLTCHDPASRWKNHLALPPGSIPRPAVNPRDPSTYAGDAARPGVPVMRRLEARDRTEVTPKPLCLACHEAD